MQVLDIKRTWQLRQLDLTWGERVRHRSGGFIAYILLLCDFMMNKNLYRQENGSWARGRILNRYGLVWVMSVLTLEQSSKIIMQKSLMDYCFVSKEDKQMVKRVQEMNNVVLMNLLKCHLAGSLSVINNLFKVHMT